MFKVVLVAVLALGVQAIAAGHLPMVLPDEIEDAASEGDVSSVLAWVGLSVWRQTWTLRLLKIKHC